MNGPQDISPGLRRYLVGTIATGAVVSAASLAAGGVAVDVELATRVVLLIGLGSVAERFTLHLTHKTAINTATVAYVAMVLTLPLPLVPLVELIAALLGQVSRQRVDRLEVAFNAAHASLSVGVMAVVYGSLDALPGMGPDLGGFGGGGVLMLTATAYQGVGSLVVAGAAALQLGTSIRLTWIGTLSEGMTIELVLAALGVVAAVLLRDAPVLLPVLALPILVLHQALQELVRLRLDTPRGAG